MEWSTSCKDWERRIVNGESLISFPPLFPSEAKDALGIFGDLRMVDAAGSPMMRDAVLPWVNDFVGAVFGAYDPVEGRRNINEFMLLISKKNGKSTIAAGIMLTALIQNWRQSGEYIILAPTKEIADNAYKPIRDMIAADEELSALFQVQDHLRTVTQRETRATLKVVAADSDTVSGKKAIGVFVDELHEFGNKAKAANMLLEATGGLTSRPEGFVIYATTQSANPPAGVFRQKLEYARKVRDGEVDDKTFLPVLYEFPKAMIDANEHRNLDNGYVTNPNWGVSVDIKYIEKLHKQALVDGEEAFKLFLSKHLNVEIGMNLRSDRWAGADFWEQQASNVKTLDNLISRSEVITVGIDGGGLDDLLGFAAIGRDKVTHDWLLWTHAWIHPIAIERRKSEASRYEDFRRDGDLTIIETLPDDVNAVVVIVKKIADSGLLASVGLDPEKTHKVMYQSLINADIEESLIVGISQGWKLVGAISVAERKLAEGKMFHGNSAMMAWCVGNAKVVPKGNAIMIDKQTSGSGKIDPLMATFNAVLLMSLNPEAAGITQGYVEL
jgi:phage terminase large subunit-like protein